MKKACSVLIVGAIDFILFPIWRLYGKMLFSAGIFESHNDIVIAQFGSKESLDPLFVPRTKDVLDFLAQVDCRRFNRVRREIKAIIKARRNSTFAAKYHRTMHACRVNVDDFGYEKDPDHAMKFYACILVHEATHAVLEEHRIPSAWATNRTTRLRIESLCIEEEVRLSRRFNDDNPERWEECLRERMSWF